MFKADGSSNLALDAYLLYGNGVSSFNANVSTNGSFFVVSYTPEHSGLHSFAATFSRGSGNIHISGSPFQLVVTWASEISATHSTVKGYGLTLATAGVQVTFTITARDKTMNKLHSGIPANIGMLIGGRTVNDCAIVHDQATATMTVGYSTTEAGSHFFNMCAGKGTGLIAKYFLDSDLKNALFDQLDPNVDFDWRLGRPGSSLIPGDVNAGAGFGIRWTGYITAYLAQEHTFSVEVSEPDERVKLWIDEQLLVDQWTSIATITPTGTFLVCAGAAYPLKLEYFNNGGTCAASLTWESNGRFGNIMKQPVSNRYLSPACEPFQGSPFLLQVEANSADDFSSVSGSGLTIGTAGISAQFTVHARDPKGNRASLASHQRFYGALQSSSGRVQSVRSKIEYGEGLGQYQGTVTPITTELDSSIVEMVSGGGLAATYYNGVSLRPTTAVASSISSVLDWSSSNSFVSDWPRGLQSDSFSARWAGYFIPDTASVYTFNVDVHGPGERVALWLDSVLILDQWTSLLSPSLSGTVAFDMAGHLHEIKLEYAAVKSNSTAQATKLRWKTAGMTHPLVMPSQSLFHAPYTLALSPLTVYPAITCASKSSISGQSTLTAGVTSRFTIESRDEFLNSRAQEPQDTYIGAIRFEDSCNTLVPQQCFANAGHCYAYPTLGAVGKYSFDLASVRSGGLLAVVYNSSDFQNPVRSKFDEQISFDWGNDSPAPDAIPYMQPFSIKWFGYVTASYNCEYTFSSISDSGASVLVNGKVVISYSGGLGPRFGVVALEKDRYYPLEISYASRGRPSFIQLRWSCSSFLQDQVISPQSLYFPGMPLANSPMASELKAGNIFAGRTTARGGSLTLSTAGIQARFSVFARDIFANLRTSKTDLLISQVAVAPSAVNQSTYLVRAVTTPSLTHDFYDVTFSLTRAGTHSLFTWVAAGGGLGATYYGNNSFATDTAVYAGVQTTVDFSGTSTGSRGVLSSVAGRPASAARWSGFLRAPFSGIYTIETSITNKPERVKMWIENEIVIDQWSSLAATVTTTILDVADPEKFYAIKFEYKEDPAASGNRGATLLWHTDMVGPSFLPVEKAPIASTNLFDAINVGLSFTDYIAGGLQATFYDFVDLTAPKITVQVPSVDFSSSSTAYVLHPDVPSSILTNTDTFSVRWMGFIRPPYAQKTDIQARIKEADERVRLWINDILVIDQWNSLQSLGPTASLNFDCGQEQFHKVEVHYHDISGAQGLSLAWNSSVSAVLDSQVIPAEYWANGVLVDGSPFVHTTNAAPFCAARSLSNGIGLTLTTAGIVSSFLITSKDDFDNSLVDGSSVILSTTHKSDQGGLGGDSTASLVQTTNGLSVSVPGGYSVAFPAVTKAGEHVLMVAKATIGGIHATYFEGIDCAPGYEQKTHAVEKNTFRMIPDTIGACLSNTAIFSVRWRGFVYPKYAETYTFQAEIQEEFDRVRLWIDHKLVIDQWASLGQPGTGFAQALTPSGTGYFMRGDMMYDLKLEYKKVEGRISGASLNWRSASQELSYIGSSRLAFADPIHGSPFPSLVLPASVCGPQSYALGAGYTVATSGTLSTFFIRARDEFTNFRITGGDKFAIEAQFQVEGSDNIYQFGTVTDFGNGTYFVRYPTLTRAGYFNMVADIAVQGGLQATYYDDTELMDPKGVKVDSRVTLLSFGSVRPNNALSDAGTFSVRWLGNVQHEYGTEAAPEMYTYVFQMRQVDERVKMWIDHRMIIDQWDSLSSVAPAGLVNVTESEQRFYHVEIHYKHQYGDAAADLRWRSANIGLSDVTSEYLYQAYALQGSPREIFNHPQDACASKTFASSAGLTSARVCTPVSFTITARDQFTNLLTKDAADLYVRLYHSPETEYFSTYHDIGTLTYIPNSKYSVAYTSFGRGTVTRITLVLGTGLLSTYYDDVDLAPDKAVATRIQPYLDFSQSACDGIVVTECVTGQPDGVVVPDADKFSVRWAGLLRTGVGFNTYTFHFHLGESEALDFTNQLITRTAERVKIWIDNQMVVDQWSSLSSTLFEFIQTFPTTRYYDIRIDYKNFYDNRYAWKLRWRSCEFNEYCIPDFTVIPPEHLFYDHDISGSPFAITTNSPIVYFSTPGNGPTAGGTVISVVGEAFGTIAECGIFAFVGQTRAPTTWLSPVSLVARAPPGIDSGHNVTVKIDKRVSDPVKFAKFTYDAPTVWKVYAPNTPATGGKLVLVSGTNIGSADYTPRVRIGGTACEATFWVSNEAVMCQTPGGFGIEKEILLTVTNRLDAAGTLSKAFTYDSPAIANQGLTNAPARGGKPWVILNSTILSSYTPFERNSSSVVGVVSTIFGIHFQFVDSCPKIRIGGTDCERSWWMSDSRLHCRPAAGIFIEREIVVTVSDHSVIKRDTLGLSFSYDTPVLSNVKLVNIPLSGSAIPMTIFGQHFGTNDYTPYGRAGLTATPTVNWISDTAVAAKTVSGASLDWYVDLSVGRLEGQMTQVFSYDIPVAISVSTQNAPALGSCLSDLVVCTSTHSLTVTGSTFGALDYSVSSRVGFTAGRASIWIADTSVSGLVAAGYMTLLDVTVSVARQLGPITDIYSYDAQILSALTPVNGQTSGSFSVTTFGLNFGRVEYSPTARFGGSACETTEWKSDSSLKVLVMTGASYGFPVVATLAMLPDASQERLTTVSASFSFDFNVLIAASPANALTLGASSLTVIGTNFAKFDGTSSAYINTECEATTWESDTTIRCKVASGQGRSLLNLVTVGYQIGYQNKSVSNTLTEAVSYDGPVVSSIVNVTNRPTHMAAAVPQAFLATIAGALFSRFDTTVSVRSGRTASEATIWSSDTMISAFASRGHHGTHRVFVTASNVVATLSEAFSHDLGLQSAVQTRNGASTGSTLVTISGYLMASYALSQRARLGQSACEQTEWISELEVHCRRPGGYGVSKFTQVTAAERLSDQGTLSHVVTFDLLQTSSLLVVNSHTSVLTALTLFGSNFASSASFTVAVRLGATSAESTVWTSDTSLICITPGGIRSTIRFVVTYGELRSTISETYSYNVGSLTNFIRTNSPTTGSVSVTLSGSTFTETSFTPTSRLGFTASEASNWISDTSVLGLIPKTFRGSLKLGVTSGLLKVFGNTATEAFSYQHSSISSLVSVNRPTTGWQSLVNASLTVFGSAFHHLDSTGSALLSNTAVASSDWFSETSLLCKPIKGETQTYRFVVTFGQRHGSASQIFSFDSSTLYQTGSQNIASTRENVTVNGLNIGRVDLTPSQRFGATTSEKTRWRSDTEVMATISRGFFSTRQHVVTSGMLSGSVTGLLSFDSPVAERLHVANARSTGSVSITVAGNAFAHVHMTNTIRVSTTSCEATEWVSETEVRCRGPGGTFSTLRAAVTSGMLSGSLTETWSFNVPFLSTLKPSNVPVHFNGAITLTSVNLDRSIRVNLGSTASESSEWLSMSSVTCKMVSGMHHTRRMSITAGKVGGSTSEAWSFNAAYVTWMGPANVASTGSVSVTIAGGQMALRDSTVRARFSATACEATEWVSATAVQCRASGSTRASLKMISTMGLLSGSITQSMSLDASRLIVMNHSHVMTQANDVKTGSISLTVFGSGLGMGMLTQAARRGMTACEATDWMSGTSIHCLSTRGMHTSTKLIATVGSKLGTRSEVLSMDSLEITLDHSHASHAHTTHNMSSTVNWPTTGSISMTLHGAGLGTVESTLKQRIHGTAAEATEWVSETEVRCRGPGGTFSTLRAAVTSGTLSGSLTEIFSYGGAAAFLKSASQLNLPRLGSHDFNLSIPLFGLAHFSASARYGSTAAEMTMWSSEISIVARMTIGILASRMVSLTAGANLMSRTELLSYDGPSLVPASALNHTLTYSNEGRTGSVSMTVHGFEFGSFQHTVAARRAFTASEASEWISDTTVYCRSGRGVPGTSKMILTSGLGVGTLTETVSFDSPELFKTNSSQWTLFINVPTTGSVSVTMLGMNIFSYRLTAVSSFGQTSCEATDWFSDTSIASLVSSGTFRTLRLVVTAGLAKASVTEMFSFDSSPSLNTIYTPVNLNPRALTDTTVRGASFLLRDQSPVLNVGLTACERSNWVSETSLVCRQVKGTGPTKSAHLTAGERTGSVTEVFSYDGPTVSAFDGAVHYPTTGSNVFTMTGQDIGVNQYSVAVRLGGSASEHTMWVGDTSVIAQIPSGVSTGHGVIISVSTELNTLTGVWTYYGPNLTAIDPANGPILGQQNITMYGRNFGQNDYAATASIGGTPCPRMHFTSDTSMACVGPIGVGVGHAAAITVAGQSDQLPLSVQYFCYDAPITDLIIPDYGPTTGNVNLTIVGANFDLTSHPAQAHFGSDSDYTGKTSTNAYWLADTTAKVLLPPGIGIAHTVALTILGYEEFVNNTFSYMAPRTASLLNASTNAPTRSQGAIATLIGDNFGTANPLSTAARFGSTACESSTWISDSTVTCGTVSGVAVPDMIVSVALQHGSSRSKSFSYDAPSIAAIQPGNSPILVMVPINCTNSTNGTTCSTRILGSGVREAGQVSGAGFVRIHYSSSLKYEQTACELSGWTSDSSMTCLAARGIGHSLAVAVSIAYEQIGTATNMISFDSPVLSVISKTNGGAYGGTVMSVFGSNCGQWGLSVGSRIGMLASERTVWLSNSAVLVKTPAGIIYGNRGLQLVAVSIETRVATVSDVYTYDLFKFSTIAATNAPAVRNTSEVVTVHGVNFMTFVSCPVARIGFTGCESTNWFSDSSVYCSQVSGAGHEYNAVITALGAVVDTFSGAFTFDFPVPTSSSVPNAPKLDANFSTIAGINFAQSVYTPAARFSGTSCESTIWNSDTSVFGNIPDGVEAIFAIVVTVESARNHTYTVGLSGSLTGTFTYDGPVNTDLGRQNAPKTGSVTLELTGRGFAVTIYSANDRIGGTGVEATAWLSDSHISLKSPHGSYTDHSVVTTLAVQSSTLFGVLTYDDFEITSTSPVNGPVWSHNTSAEAVLRDVYILGSGFSHVSLSPVGRIGFTSCEKTEWVSESSVLCTISATGIPGVMGPAVITTQNNATGLIYVNSESSEWLSMLNVTTMFSFDVPLVTTMFYANTIRSGQQARYALGHNFASFDLSGLVRQGDTACTASIWMSATSVQCQTPSGSGEGLPIILTLRNMISTVSHVFSYDDMSVTGSVPANGPKTGGYWVEFRGANYGLFNVAPQNRLAGTACSESNWRSDSVLLCKTSRGMGVELLISVTVSPKFSTRRNMFTYDSPAVSYTRFANNPTVVPAILPPTIKVFGSEFGTFLPSLSSRHGDTTCVRTNWVSGTVVFVKAAAGQRHSWDVGLTIVTQISTLSGSTTYDSPKLSTLSSVNGPGTGSRPVTIHGLNFAQYDTTQFVRIGGTAAEASWWISDTSVYGLTSAGGDYLELAKVTTVATQIETASASFTFDGPTISQIGEHFTNCTACNQFEMLGQGFGHLSHSLKARLGGVAGACEATTWISESSATCKIARLKNHAGDYTQDGVRITVHNQEGRLSQTITYSTVDLSDVFALNSAPATSMVVTLSGTRFGSGLSFITAMELGVADWSPLARLGGSACEFSAWVSETSMKCKTTVGSSEVSAASVSVALTKRATLSRAFTYDSVAIDSIAQITGCTTCATITINGKNMGVSDLTIAIRVGGPAGACEATRWISDSSAACRMASTVSSFLNSSYVPGIQMTVLSRVATLSSTFTFTSSQVSSIGGVANYSNLPMVGTTVSIYGSRFGAGLNFMSNLDFGSIDTTLTARIGLSACEATAWISDTTVSCQTSRGFGLTRNSAVTVGLRVSTITEVVSFDSPRVSKATFSSNLNHSQWVAILNGPRNAAPPLLLQVVGTAYSSHQPTLTARIGRTACENTIWISDTILIARVGMGVLQSWKMVVTAGYAYPGTATHFVSYDGPTGLGGPSLVNFAVAVVTNASIGLTTSTTWSHADLSVSVRLGVTTAEGSAWVSDTSLTCRGVTGYRPSLAMMLTAGGQGGSITHSLTYDRPDFSAHIGVTVLTNAIAFADTTQSSVTVTGVNFGLDQLSSGLRFGSTASETTLWISTTALLGKVSMGLSPTRHFAVTAGMQQGGSTTEILSFDASVLSSVAPVNGATANTATLTLSGSTGGITNSTGGITNAYRVGKTASESSAWVSDTSLFGRSPTGGPALYSNLVVTAGVKAGTLSDVFTYNNPSISSAFPTNVVWFSGLSLSIIGNGFATSTFTQQNRLGFTACEATGWNSDSNVRCLAADGLSMAAGSVVTSGAVVRIETVTEAYTYDGPAATGMFPANTAASGRGTITISGAPGFGQFDSSVAARIGGSACEATAWLCWPDSAGNCLYNASITCKTPQGTGPFQRVSLTVMKQVTTLTFSFTYNLPRLDQIFPVNGPATGGINITLSGGGYGLEDYQPKAILQGSACEQTTFYSDSSLVCKVSPGLYDQHDLVVSVSGLTTVGDGFDLFTFDQPILSSIGGQNSATTGGSTATLYGANFGTSSSSLRGRIVPGDCESTEWVSDSSLLCKISRQTGIGHGFTVTIPTSDSSLLSDGALQATFSGALSYDAPTITDITPLNSATSGGITVTIKGSNFGPAPNSVVAVIVQSGYSSVCPAPVSCEYPTSDQACLCVEDFQCTIITGNSFDTLIVRSGAGVGLQKPFQVTVDGQSVVSAGNFTFDFDPPSILLVYPNFGGSAGLDIISIFGTNFGPASAVAKINISTYCDPGAQVGATARTHGCEQGLNLCNGVGYQTPHSVLLCQVPTGTGSGLDIVTSIDYQMATQLSAFSYAQPQPALTFPSYSATTGSGVVTIFGANFGDKDYTPAASIGNTACQEVIWTSDSLISCQLAPGVGKSLGLEVESNSQTGSRGNSFSYRAPRVTSIFPFGGITAGGYPATIYGNNFGTADYTPLASLGDFACPSTVYTSDTSVKCDIPPGAGVQYVLVTVAGQQPGPDSDITLEFSYDPPKLSSVSRVNDATLGGLPVTLYGMNFGVVDTTPLVAIGNRTQYAYPTVWTSDTTMTAHSPFGAGKELPVYIKLGRLLASTTQMFSYDKPAMDSMTPAFGPTSGGFTITLQGKNFGNPVSTSVGDTKGNVIAGSVAPSSLEILAPPGTGVSHSVPLTVGGQVSPEPFSFSYLPPTLTAVEPVNGPTSGGFSITVLGSNFGTALAASNTLLQATIGSTSTTSVVSVDEHESVKILAAAGAGTGVGAQISVDSQTSASVPALFSYDRPLITHVSPRFYPTTGYQLVIVQGENFGQSGSAKSITVGDTPCITTGYTSHTQLSCLVSPGIGINHVLRVDIQGQSSTGPSTAVGLRFSYSAPTVAALQPANNPATGTHVITFSGANFGVNDYQPTGRVGLTACVTSTWTSDTSLTCIPPRGLGFSKDADVSVERQRGTLVGLFTYDQVSLTDLIPRNGPTSSNLRITAFGSNFGTFDSTPGVYLGGTESTNAAWATHDCEGITRTVCWTSDTSIAFIPAYGAGVSKDITVEILGKTSTLTLAFSYDKPVITQLNPANAPTVGSDGVTVSGKNFGAEVNTRSGTLNGVSTVLSYVGHGQVVLTTPAGTGAGRQVSITVEGQSTTFSGFFCYDAPVITSISPVFGPAAGAAAPKLTVQGVNFGAVGQAAPEAITVNGQTCASLSLETNTKFTCTIPANTRTSAGSTCTSCNALNIPVAVSVDGLTGISRDFSYTNDGSSQAASSLWCQALQTAFPSGNGASNALRWVDPDGDGDTADATQVYCLQTGDGGGWSKILQYATDSYTPTTTASGLVATTLTGDGKLSDENINLIGGQRQAKLTGNLQTVLSSGLFTLGAESPPFTNTWLGYAITIGSETRIITAYTSARQVAVTPSFTSAPSGGGEYTIYGPMKEYRILSEGYTTSTDEVPSYRLFLRSAKAYTDTSFGQGIATGTSHAIAACLAVSYTACTEWVTLKSPGYIDSLAFGFASGQAGANDDCNRLMTDFNGGPNFCFGHFTDSVTFEAASDEARCFVTGACAEGAIIGKGVKHTYLSIFVRNYVDTDGTWADSD